MTAKNILLKWFCDMIEKYPDICFMYKFQPDRKSHYIAVFPAYITDNELYCQDENDIFGQLDSEYPDDSFIFGTEYKNFKVTSDFVSYDKDNLPEYDINLIQTNPSQSKTLSSTVTILIEKTSSSYKEKYTKEISIFTNNRVKTIPC